MPVNQEQLDDLRKEFMHKLERSEDIDQRMLDRVDSIVSAIHGAEMDFQTKTSELKDSYQARLHEFKTWTLVSTISGLLSVILMLAHKLL